MSDVINTLRGPSLFPSGTIRGHWYIIPVQGTWTVTLDNLWSRPVHDREYYERRADGEWHWSHTEPAGYQKYPAPPPPPEHPLPEGI